MASFNNLESKIMNMEFKLDGMQKSMEDFHIENKEQHCELSKQIEKIEAKKADKEVVDEIRGDIRKVVWIIISAVVIALLALVINPKL